MQRPLTVLLIILLVAAVMCIWSLALAYHKEQMEIMSTWSTMANYQRVRDRLSDLSSGDDATWLAVFTHVQPTYHNHSLSLIIESENVRITQDLITDLRKKTKKDLGDDPQVWIKAYAPQFDSQNTN